MTDNVELPLAFLDELHAYAQEHGRENLVDLSVGGRARYSTDAGNYRVVPAGVCFPQSTEDVLAILAACRAHAPPSPAEAEAPHARATPAGPASLSTSPATSTASSASTRRRAPPSSNPAAYKPPSKPPPHPTGYVFWPRPLLHEPGEHWRHGRQ